MMIRLIGFLFILLGALLFGIDLAPVLTEGRDFHASAVGEWWVWLHQDSLLLLQPAIERYISPKLWDPVMLTLLELPAFIEAVLLGLLLWIIGGLFRRRQRRR